MRAVKVKVKNAGRLPALQGLKEFLSFGVIFVAFFFDAEFFGVGL